MFSRRKQPPPAQQPQQPPKPPTPPPSENTNTTSLAQMKAIASTPIIPMYHPSIFRYTCRGRLRLDSKTPTAGICQGFQSQLEHVDHWRLCTKDEAIQVFQQNSLEEPAPDGNSEVTNTSSQESAATAHALQNIYLSNVLVYPFKEEGGNETKEETTTTKQNAEQPDEQWSCVGSTEVDLLVLRPQHSKDESIAAVSPYCAPGMTVREVSTSTLGRDRNTTIRLGVVEIVYQSSVAEEELEDQQLSSTAAATAKDPKQSEEDNKEPAVSKPQKVYLASTNILKHMQINAQLLYQATQDEFPQRTYQASQRIFQECGNTWDRMNGLVKRIWSWQDDDDDKKR